jgi:hypothetical protein
MENSRLHEQAPTSVNVTVGRRSREYLTEREVERLIEAAKQNRSGHRDATAMPAWSRHHGSGSSAYFWQSGLIAASHRPWFTRRPTACLSSATQERARRRSAMIFGGK